MLEVYRACVRVRRPRGTFTTAPGVYVRDGSCCRNGRAALRGARVADPGRCAGRARGIAHPELTTARRFEEAPSTARAKT